MKKTLRFSLLSLALMLAGNMMAQGVTIDFDNDYAKLFPTLTGTSANDSHDGDFTEATTSTAVDGFTVTVSAKDEGVSNANRIWSGAPRLRMYSGTFTVSGKGIKKIEFTGHATNFNLSTATGTLDGKTWTGEADEVVFTVAKNTQINKLVINGDGETPTTDKGTQENPYTVAQAQELLATLAPNVKSDVVYAKGKISKIDEVETVQYGNATFYISDTGSEEGQLEVFRCVFLEKSKFTATDQIKVGDEVIICGQLVNYRSSKAAETDPVTPEFTQGCYIYSLNGKTKAEGGETPEPQVTKISVAEALTAINALADGAKSESSYIVKGYIVGTPEFQRKADGTLYGNANFTIADEKGGSVTLTIFRAKNLENVNFDEETISTLKEGDLVEVQGLLQKYVKEDVTTPELVSCYLISVSSGEGPVVPEPTAISVADALAAIDALSDGAKSSDEYIVKGYIVGAPDFQRKADGSLYGNVNCTIADEKGGATTLTIFRAKNFENVNFDEETISLLKEGDLVEFKGLLQKYVKNDVTTPELVSCYLISVNGKDAASVKALKLDQDANAPAYNLGGQQVSTGYRGLIIRNGRKFINK